MDSNPFKCQVNSIHKQRIEWFGSLETNHSLKPRKEHTQLPSAADLWQSPF